MAETPMAMKATDSARATETDEPEVKTWAECMESMMTMMTAEVMMMVPAVHLLEQRRWLTLLRHASDRSRHCGTRH
jgi:hypothetical protein